MTALFGNLMENAIAAVGEKYSSSARAYHSEREFCADVFNGLNKKTYSSETEI